MKLFVWHDVLMDYTGGIAFAMADTVEQARDLILADHMEKMGRYSRSLKRDIALDPDEIHEGPAGGHCYGGA